MQIVVDGLLTTYVRTGDTQAPTLVLVHGWADSQTSFSDLRTVLSKTFDVVGLDLPGFGGSQMPSESWTLDNFASFIRAFIDKVDILRPYALIGHSNGGAIIIRGLASGVLQTEKLILLASAGIRKHQTSRRLGFKLVAKVGKVVTAPLSSPARRTLRRRLYQAAGSDMLVAEHMQQTFKKIVSQDIQVDAKKLTLPTLLIYGKNDVDAPPQYGVKLHEAISGSILKVLPDAGHFVHLDQSEEVSRAVLEFLK